MSGYRTLDEGTEVEFELKTGPKGLQAENVTRA
jgi:CspA family cold shock protein